MFSAQAPAADMVWDLFWFFFPSVDMRSCDCTVRLIRLVDWGRFVHIPRVSGAAVFLQLVNMGILGSVRQAQGGVTPQPFPGLCNLFPNN